MAKAFKCDICGNFYVLDDTDEAQYNQMELMYKDYRGYPESSSVYDICPDCDDAICNLIKERGNHETAEKTDQESEGTAGEE